MPEDSSKILIHISFIFCNIESIALLRFLKYCLWQKRIIGL